MTAPLYFVYDGDSANGISPRRPGLDDVGGAQFTDDQEFPPDPQEFPCARDENQQEKLIVGHARVAPAAILSVEISAGTPVVALCAAVSTNVTASTFTITDHGAGDTTIAWPADTFPPSNSRPKITLDQDLAMLAPTYVIGSNSVRVKTRNSAGTLTDCNFTIELSGQTG